MKTIYVAIGALLGSASRYWLSLLLPLSLFPWHSLIVNTVGSLLLGIITFHPKLSQNMRYLFGVGCLGSFTTFSTFTLDFILLFENGQYAVASLYIITTLVAGILAAYVGMLLVKGRAVL